MQRNKERKTQKDKDTKTKTQRHLPFNEILKVLRALIQNIKYSLLKETVKQRQ